MFFHEPYLTLGGTLLCDVQEAEVAELQAYRQSQLHDKKSLAIATLVEGRPQAYVDFFYLTHSNPPNASVASAQHHGTVIQQAPDADGELPQESLGLLRAQLIRAEAASKAGEWSSNPLIPTFDTKLHTCGAH